MAPDSLHKAAVYFGLEDLTPEEEREKQAAEEKQFSRPLRRLVIGAVLMALLQGALFGALTWILWDDPLADAPLRGALFAVAMLGLNLWRVRSGRRKAAARARERAAEPST